VMVQRPPSVRDSGAAPADEPDDSDALYGRVLFKDGTPAALQPTPWPGAKTRISLGIRGGSTEVGQVDSDGYFVLHLEDSQREALAAGPGRAHLSIMVPMNVEKQWEYVAHFPFEKLGKSRQDAGAVAVRRSLPTVALPPELREGGPLPDGWQLDSRATSTAGGDAYFNGYVTASDSQKGLQPGDVEFVIYDPNGNEATRFRHQPMLILGKAQKYTLIARQGEGRRPDDWRITHGPFLLDMSQPGFYKLSIDLSVVPEAETKSRKQDTEH